MKDKQRKPIGIKLIDSFNYAINGVITAVETERNMKIHYTIAILVLLASLFFDFNRTEFMLLFFAIALVLISELLNTAIEKTVDLVTEEYHEFAKIAKDIAAGAVLVAAINSVIVGYLLFYERMTNFGEILLFKITNSPTHMTVIAIILVFFFTILFKIIFKKFSQGTHLHGGVVSGHSSLAFCAATIISTLANNTTIAILAYIMAILVAESRVEGKIHSIFEVFMGAVLGSLIGILIFQVFGG